MLNISQVEKGMVLNIESQLQIVAEINFVSPGKGPAFYKIKLKNLMSGNVVERTFKSGEQFEEAEIEKISVKFLYTHRGKYFFKSEKSDESKDSSLPFAGARVFDLPKELIGKVADFMKQNQVVEGVVYKGNVLSISLPIKVFLKVTEAPPGTKGDRAQSGTKTIKLETGAEIQVPLFVEEGDLLEVNTETGEYVRRVE